MCFDVTFHPISPEDITFFVEDVVLDPTFAPSRIERLDLEPAFKDAIRNAYGFIADFRKSVESGESDFAHTFSFMTAIVAGFLHPYWYSRGCAVSFLPDVDPTIGPILESPLVVMPRLARQMSDPSNGRITTNFISGAYVSQSNVVALKSYFADPKNGDHIARIFSDNGRDSLLEAIEYATEHRLGLLEASDVIVPLFGECVTNPNNARRT